MIYSKQIESEGRCDDVRVCSKSNDLCVTACHAIGIARTSVFHVSRQHFESRSSFERCYERMGYDSTSASKAGGEKVSRPE
jgi:hypothetical protein